MGQYTPKAIDQLFISIQTFNSQDFTTKTSPGFYDFIVVDEIHHGPADSYQKLLNYYQPKILLGLTATPERLDGKSVLPYFGDRIAAEMFLHPRAAIYSWKNKRLSIFWITSKGLMIPCGGWLAILPVLPMIVG